MVALRAMTGAPNPSRLHAIEVIVSRDTYDASVALTARSAAVVMPSRTMNNRMDRRANRRRSVHCEGGDHGGGDGACVGGVGDDGVRVMVID